MRRALNISPRFRKALRRFLAMHPELTLRVEVALQILQNDPFTPSLDIHRLHGALADFYGCRITYQYRLVFYFDEKYIQPHSIGAHDAVY